MSEDHKPQQNQEKLEVLVSQDVDHEEVEALNNQEECKTPTSSESKIPAVQSCPPTPKKEVRVFLHKRKRPDDHQLHFFETANRDEVESFFRSSSFDLPASTVESRRPIKIRRCRSY
ncbi:hypothetical protein Tsubulata_010857 [Turnera subulata]|uniref:Cyclin-dependent protein kinase inhibitor SMR2 n=1 Tax=Turnera subulata TaxID=218843 RepID=A0A9Q0FRN6_9ROSI|nr:hypothetical protein Tsubulata_010857 [Turnera subulata]